jgi:hypothetical protein
MKTRWTDKRLRDLFERYNQIYWRGALPRYRVVETKLSQARCVGRCDWRKRTIEIDTDEHNSDRGVRATLLHEMAHAAARGGGHGEKFFAQLDRLMRSGAPVTVDFPEAGAARILKDIVPRRFPVLRAKIDRVENRRQRDVLSRSRGLPIIAITDDMIVERFADAASTFPWKQALVAVGLENGLTDETGRPVNAWARRIVSRARGVHRRARRDHLEYQKRWAFVQTCDTLQ